jgi:hypothetical protein
MDQCFHHDIEGYCDGGVGLIQCIINKTHTLTTSADKTWICDPETELPAICSFCDGCYLIEDCHKRKKSIELCSICSIVMYDSWVTICKECVTKTKKSNIYHSKSKGICLCRLCLNINEDIIKYCKEIDPMFIKNCKKLRGNGDDISDWNDFIGLIYDKVQYRIIKGTCRTEPFYAKVKIVLDEAIYREYGRQIASYNCRILPVDLLKMILFDENRMPLKDILKNCRYVCRTWYNVIEEKKGEHNYWHNRRIEEWKGCPVNDKPCEMFSELDYSNRILKIVDLITYSLTSDELLAYAIIRSFPCTFTRITFQLRTYLVRLLEMKGYNKFWSVKEKSKYSLITIDIIDFIVKLGILKEDEILIYNNDPSRTWKNFVRLLLSTIGFHWVDITGIEKISTFISTLRSHIIKTFDKKIILSNKLSCVFDEEIIEDIEKKISKKRKRKFVTNDQMRKNENKKRKLIHNQETPIKKEYVYNAYLGFKIRPYSYSNYLQEREYILHNAIHIDDESDVLNFRLKSYPNEYITVDGNGNIQITVSVTRDSGKLINDIWTWLKLIFESYHREELKTIT